MSDSSPPTIEEFYRQCAERKLMAVRCVRCKHIMVPTRQICPKCRSSRVEWVQLGTKGKLVTYTIVHGTLCGRDCGDGGGSETAEHHQNL